jgi:hypothetical protein
MAESNGALSLAGLVSLQLYRELLKALGSVGTFQEEIKKTSIHLVGRLRLPEFILESNICW